MPTRPVTKKPKLPKSIDGFRLSSPNFKECSICGKKTTRTIINRYNRIQHIEIFDIEKLDWDAVARYIDVLSKRNTITLPNGGILSHCNVYSGYCSSISWDMSSGNRVEDYHWRGEDFSKLFPNEIYLFSRTGVFNKRKDKKAAIIKHLTKLNEERVKKYGESTDYDTRVSCCSSVCLNMWLLRKDT